MTKRKVNVATKVPNKKRKRGVVEEGTIVSIPAAVGAVTRRTARSLKMATIGDSTIVCNTELLVSFSTSALFGSQGMALAPFNLGWLSGINLNYSKWRWRRLRLVWIPACPTTTSGQAVIGLDYDFQDSNPNTLAVAQAQYKAISFPYWAGYEGTSSLHDFDKPRDGAVIIDLDTNRLGNGLGLAWYRTMSATDFNTLSNADKNLYCPAVTSFSHSGGPAVSVVAGNIFAHYEVEYIEPQVAGINF